MKPLKSILMDLMGYLVLLKIAIDREKQGFNAPFFSPSNEGKFIVRAAFLSSGSFCLPAHRQLVGGSDVSQTHEFRRDTLYPNIKFIPASICRNFKSLEHTTLRFVSSWW